MSGNQFLEQFLKNRGKVSATAFTGGRLPSPDIIGKAPEKSVKKPEAESLKDLVRNDASKKEVREYFQRLSERLKDEREEED